MPFVNSAGGWGTAAPAGTRDSEVFETFEGNQLIIFFTYGNFTGEASYLTDLAGNKFYRVEQKQGFPDDTSQCLEAWICPSTLAHAANVLTVHLSASSPFFFSTIEQWSGLSVSGPTSSTTWALGAIFTSTVTDTITTQTADCVLFHGVMGNVSGFHNTLNAPAGFTKREEEPIYGFLATMDREVTGGILTDEDIVTTCVGGGVTLAVITLVLTATNWPQQPALTASTVSAGSSGITNTDVTNAFPVVAGAPIAAWIGWQTAVSPQTLTTLIDTVGTVYTRRGGRTNIGGLYLDLWTGVAAGAHAANILTATFSGTVDAIQIAAGQWVFTGDYTGFVSGVNAAGPDTVTDPFNITEAMVPALVVNGYRGAGAASTVQSGFDVCALDPAPNANQTAVFMRVVEEETLAMTVATDGLSGAAGISIVAYFASSMPPPVPPPGPGTARYIRRTRRFPLPFAQNLDVFVDRLEFVMQQGIALANGQGSLPIIEVRFSTDGGETWGPMLLVGCGRRGQRWVQAVIEPVGMLVNGYCEISVTDPVPWSFLQALIDATVALP